MRMRSARAGVCIALAWLAITPLAGQETTDVAPPPSARFPAAWYPPDNNVTSTMTPDKRAPYEARMVTEVQHPGLPIEQQPLQARDSAGRMRSETLEIRLKDGAPVTVRAVEVDDPVSHCSFQWGEPWVNKSAPTATVQCMPRTVHYSAQSMWSSVASMKSGEEHPSPDETDQTEALGERTFDGVRAVGFRRVRIIKNPDPKQTQTIESEIWTAPEMKEIVAIHMKGPGGYGFELRDIKLRDPDPMLFYPPANYTIVPAGTQP